MSTLTPLIKLFSHRIWSLKGEEGPKNTHFLCIIYFFIHKKVCFGIFNYGGFTLYEKRPSFPRSLSAVGCLLIGSNLSSFTSLKSCTARISTVWLSLEATGSSIRKLTLIGDAMIKLLVLNLWKLQWGMGLINGWVEEVNSITTWTVPMIATMILYWNFYHLEQYMPGTGFHGHVRRISAMDAYHAKFLLWLHLSSSSCCEWWFKRTSQRKATWTLVAFRVSRPGDFLGQQISWETPVRCERCRRHSQL